MSRIQLPPGVEEQVQGVLNQHAIIMREHIQTSRAVYAGLISVAYEQELSVDDTPDVIETMFKKCANMAMKAADIHVQQYYKGVKFVKKEQQGAEGNK